MTLKKYLILMLISTIACWLALILVINYVDPSQAGFIGFLFFYLSLFFALIGTTAIVGFFLRLLVKTKEIMARVVLISFRQAFFLSSLMVVLLFLQSKKILFWWNASLLILAITFIESFFISLRKNKKI